MRNSMGYYFGMPLLLALVLVACGDHQSRTPTISTPVDLFAGAYSLRVAADSACTIPEAVRSRSYAASIAPLDSDSYVVTLSDARFLVDEQIGERTFIPHCSSWYRLDCSQFTASREGDQLRFRLASNSERFDDEFAGHGGSIVELVPPDDSRLGISGNGFGRSDGITIQATIAGSMWLCPAKYSSFDRECAGCRNTELAMTFTRR